MRVIVDCMGGDKAPLEVVKGAYAASLEYNANFILVGDRAEILRIADAEAMDLRRFDIVDAPLTIEPGSVGQLTYTIKLNYPA